MSKKELWLRLHNYHFNELVPPNLWDKVTAKFGGADASTKAFAHKLAIKLGWKADFAQRAVLEYKRFVYLGVVSDFVVTPSDIIDQVWHQHILFSKAYRSFCTDIIEYDFDHTPELIASGNQTGTFSAQYFDTLELYRKEFGVDAPATIWGTPKFDEQALAVANYRSKKKEKAISGYDGSGAIYSDVGLYQSFDTNSGESFFDFGGGDSGGAGAGAGGSWDADDSSSDSSSSDSGSSCSSCSSGCGGGD
jgi:hypothetical protein